MIELQILSRKFLSSRKVVTIHIFKESIENGTFGQYQVGNFLPVRKYFLLPISFPVKFQADNFLSVRKYFLFCIFLLFKRFLA